ncbi:MAG: hypothetical protein IJ715_03780 [Bacilli bacterium]|nr:hypothetical protein [Bacilli bacterium]
MNIETIIKKEKKKYKIVFLVCIITTIVGIPLLAISSNLSDEDKKNATHFKKKLNKLAYIEPTYLSEPFYYYDDEQQSYRFVEDKSGDIYVINVFESDVSDIKNYNSKIYGRGRELDENKIKYLTEEFSKQYENVTEDKVREIYGVYFDTSNVDSPVVAVLLFFGVMFGVLAPFMLFVYLCLYRSFKKSIKHLTRDRIEEINKELNGNINQFNKLNIVLTDNYLLAYSKKLLCFNYSDIFMIYKQKITTKRVSNYFLYIIDKSGKTYQLGSSNQFATKRLNEIDDIINMVSLKNPEVLIDQTEENNKLLKEFRKEIKNNKKNKITN